MLPTVDFFGTEVTRLMMGSNPFNGFTYIPEVFAREDMLDYYTADNVIKAFHSAWEAGINTCVTLADTFMMRAIRQYRNEGGRMNFIAQTHTPVRFDINVSVCASADLTAMFQQGGTTDELFESGNFVTLRDHIKMMKDTGLPAGIATHRPEVIARSEDEDWGVDFYMACAHNLREHPRGWAGKDEFTFIQQDRDAMFDTIARAGKPCIAFKVLWGGKMTRTEQDIEAALRETYLRIKPCDTAVVGVFQKYTDQIKQNADIVRRILE